ncbi:MAG: hypothetical protein P4L34_04180 [Paludibacter sp.]|nr:hypothetical protein [Paludibacter sp.]
MMKYLGVFLSDQPSRDGIQFTISALEDTIWQGSIVGTPTNISHDIHRTAGWSFTKGLFFAPNKVLVMGCTWVADSENDYEIISDAKSKYFTHHLNTQIQPHYTQFIDALKELYIEDKGKWFYNSIVLYGYNDIVFNAFPDLSNQLDKDGLIEIQWFLDKFEHLSQGVFKKKDSDLAVILHPYFRKSTSIFNNFNWEFIDEFLSFAKVADVKIKIKIDGDFLGYAPSFITGMEFEYWWGPKYNDDISSIPSGLTTYGSSDYEKLYYNLVKTEFVWKNDNDLYTFEMEEVKNEPAPTLKDTYTCRYVHSIYDSKNKSFNHFDGAIRAYDTDLMIDRLDKKMTEMGRRSQYTKLFRIDGSLPLSSWKSLVTKYLQGNPQIYEYFELQKPNIDLEKQDETKTAFEKYLPYSINKGEGIRLYVSYREKVKKKTINRYISSCDEILLENGKFKALEYFTVELVKAIRRVGASIDLPNDCLFIIPEDYYCNIPCITHGDTNTQKLVNETVDGIKLLITQLLKNNSNEVISFSLSWDIDENEVLISFIGHIFDLDLWFKSFDSIPTHRDGFKSWLTAQSKFIKENGIENQYPVLSEIIKDDGMLFFTRRLILKDIKNMSFPDKSNHNLYEIEFDEGKEDLAELLRTQQLYMAPLINVKKMICNKTGLNYIESPYSAIFNETQQELVDCEMLCFYWTDKPRPISIG